MKQPLSPMAYTVISLIAFIIGIAILLLFIFKAEDLIAPGIYEKVFYILLFPMGFSAAAFLFGAMRAYAIYSGNVLGGRLELGGPVVLFLLVIIFGFTLVPDTRPFDFTIFLRDVDGKTVLKSEGAIKIILDNDIKKGKIDEEGRVDFKNIPVKFKNANVPVELEIDYGWQFANGKTATDCILKGNNTIITIKRDASLSIISGTVTDEEGNFIVGARVMVKDIFIFTDDNGRFTIEIPPEKQEKEQTLTVHKQGFEKWEEFVCPASKPEIPVILIKKQE